MDIRKYNRIQLREFIDSADFSEMPLIPISRHRALSQICNPRADENDILLAVSFEEKRMTGYLGVLPDLIFLNNRSIKAGWLSCFWVDEAFRSSPAPAALLLEIMDAWDGRILITNFVPSLLTFYLKTGLFNSAIIVNGIRGYLRLNLGEILPPKNSIFRRIGPVLSVADVIFNSIADLRFAFRAKLPQRDYNVKDHLDSELYEFIDFYNSDNLTRRSLNEIRWILNHPWVLQKNPDTESRKYYFSSVSKRFFYRIIRIGDKTGNSSGFVMVLIRDNHMTVPYIFSDKYENIAGILIDLMVELKCSMLTIFHPGLVQAVKKVNGPFLFKKGIKRHYLIAKKISTSGNQKFQDGDGDCAFY